MKKGITFILLLTSFFYVAAQSTGKYQIKFLEINKSNSDYGVAILDNNKLIFTSAEEKIKSSRKNYNPRKDLFVGDIDFDGEIKNIKPVKSNVDTKFNETGVAYTSDKKTVYFSRNKYEKKISKQKLAKNQRLILYKADVDADGNWSNIKKLPFNKRAHSSGLPVLNKDNSKLYFVSDRLPSKGKTDIFVVDILGNGKYSKPRNLGPNVNTDGNETTPFITDDNILYFSSDGHPGKGNLDVFAVEVYDDKTSEIYQLASPINSINDDFAYIVNKDNNQGFFTSNRLQGKGFNDLYGFTLEEDIRPGECFISVEGKVKDKDSQEIIAGATVDLYSLEGELLESVTTYNDGTYNFTVSCANEYKLIASNDNYKNNEKRIEILEENYHTALHTNMDLTKLYEKKKVIEKLQPIYYGFDDATITNTSAIEMDKIVAIMNENPELIIEASSFTDSRGSDAYNQRLSQRRAKAAVEYLKSQGIDVERIRSKGYGEEKLTNQCVNGMDCEESAHQMNRRTEFNFVNIQSISRKRNIYRKKSRLAEASEQNKTKAADVKKTTATHANTEIAVSEKASRKKEPEANAKTAWKPEIEKAPIKNEEIAKQESIAVQKELVEKTTEKAPVATTQLAVIEKERIKNEVNASASPALQAEINKEAIVNKEAIAQSTKDHEAAATESTGSKKVIKEAVIVNYKSSIVAVDKENNKVLNYIESEKLKVMDELSSLENKYEQAMTKFNHVAGDLKTEKENILDLKSEVEKLEETGWSNIISYKNRIMDFNQKYVELTGENEQRVSANFKSSEKNYELTRRDKKDKKILEENLRINSIEVVAMKVNSKGKYQKTSNAKKTDLIKVKFKLLHNDHVTSGEKDAHIILQNPEGKVTDAKGVFTIKDSNVMKKYTDHTIIDYNKNDIDVTMFIQRKGTNYEKGVYPVKLFLEGQLVGVSNLNLASAF